MHVIMVIRDFVRKFISERRLASLGIAGGIIALGGVAFGFLSSLFFVSPDLADRVQNRLQTILPPTTARLKDTINIEWNTIETSNQTIEVAKIPTSEFGGGVNGGLIAGFENTIVIVSRHGFISYLDLDDGTLRYDTNHVPMNFEALWSKLGEHEAFLLQEYRINDVLLDTSDPNSAPKLVVSHLAYRAGREEICPRISTTELTGSGSQLAISATGWDVLYQPSECFDLTATNWDFPGRMSGGRMAQLPDGDIVFALGDFHEFRSGVSSGKFPPAFSEILTRVHRIDRSTGEIGEIAKGFRNPSGLALDQNGRLWEVEHGPQGGDEVNLVREGANFGWPFVSYGHNYAQDGLPRRALPLNTEQGRHEDFEKPAFAFVPSVAPSGLAVIEGGLGFKAWDGDLVMGGLISESLFRLRPEGDKIIYAEQIDLGTRLRDVRRLENGLIAVKSDRRELILIRDPSEPDMPRPEQVSGYHAMYDFAIEATTQNAMDNPGRTAFSAACATCHAVGAGEGVGPHLDGILGRPVAAVDGYPYSQALQEVGGVWTEARLEAYLEDPQGFASGTSMPASGLTRAERRSVIEYLKER